jgi:thiamine biosynthesis lipoprotein
LRLQVYGTTVAAAGDAWVAVLAEFAAVDAALSRHRDDSELTALNRLAGSGRTRQLGRRLYVAVAAADRARRLTDGRFDARVLADLERLGDHGAPLDAAQHRATGSSFQRVPRARAVTLDRAHDLGGIGKGLALRWAADAATKVLGLGIGFLLEAGGDITVRNMPVDQAAWAIAIEDPGSEGSPVAVVTITGGAICTSSIARRHWQTEDGRAAHHLIDPRSGEPGGDGLRAVTVAATDPAWAEVWSKALFLEGRVRIAEAARGRGLAAWWIDVDRTLAMTPAARVRTIWTREPGAIV